MKLPFRLLACLALAGTITHASATDINDNPSWLRYGLVDKFGIPYSAANPLPVGDTVAGPLGPSTAPASAVATTLADASIFLNAVNYSSVVAQQFDTIGYQSFDLTLTGTYVGNFNIIEGDDGTNFSFIAGHIDNSVGTVVDVTTIAGGATGTWCFPAQGRYARVTMSSYTSGTATVTAVGRQTPCEPRSVFATPSVGTAAATPSRSAEVGSSVAADGIVPVVAGSAASGLIIKGSPGTLYSASATCTAACWLMVFNATTVPADGATTAGVATGNLQECVPIASGGSGSINYGAGPGEVFSVGISATISSTACATKTAATTGFIHGSAR